MAEKDAYESNNHRAELAAYVLIVGLAIEFVAALVFNADWLETAVTLVAIALIVGGVWGEIHFGRKAREAGDKQLAQYEARTAEANARALEAQTELERLKKKVGPRSLLLEPLLQALEGKSKPTIPVEVLYLGDDEESYLLAVQISFALSNHAKWPAIHPKRIPPEGGHPEIPRSVWEHGQMSGVAVVENPPPGSDATLGGALKVGLLPSFGRISWARTPDLAVGAIRIVVAPKPP